jgi:threonyl-tRNA synthetase
VRQFAQDDCHVFISEAQIAEEVRFLLDFILGYYQTFGLTATLKFATRPEVRIGTDELWDRAESALRSALDATGMAYELKPGDGRFTAQDRLRRHRSIGRPCSLARSARLQRPSVSITTLVRTTPRIARRPPSRVSGSLERFIAILIEHFAGAFPVWLAPEQVRVLPITTSTAPTRSR